MGRMVQELILGRALPSSKANIGGVNGGKLHKYGTDNLLNFSYLNVKDERCQGQF